MRAGSVGWGRRVVMGRWFVGVVFKKGIQVGRGERSFLAEDSFPRL